MTRLRFLLALVFLGAKSFLFQLSPFKAASIMAKSEQIL